MYLESCQLGNVSSHVDKSDGTDFTSCQSQPFKPYSTENDGSKMSRGECSVVSLNEPKTVFSANQDTPSVESKLSDSEAYLRELRDIKLSDFRTDKQTREQVRVISRKLTKSLDDPDEIGITAVVAPLQAAIVRTALDLGLFTLLSDFDGFLSTQELAQRSNAHELLIKRIMQLLSSMDFVGQVAQDMWHATPVTKAMAKDYIAAGFRFRWDITVTTAIKAPLYFNQFGYHCPTQANSSMHQFAHRTDLDVFDFMSREKPDRLHDFNMWMGHTLGSRKYWMETYSVDMRLLNGADEDYALMVDVGGGKGHDIQAFCNKFPDIKGRLILQDLPHILESIAERSLNPSIELQTHNFFQPNPVQGARAYFLHHILHDWNDEACIEILTHIRGAMTPSYSKLLIVELILPEEGVTEEQATFDVMMMLFNSGMERSQSQWTNLLQRAGFDTVEFYKSIEGCNADGIIEVSIN